LDAHDAVGEEAGGGLFDRAFRRMMAAREARARALIYGHLARLNDASLVELGYEPNDIRRIRASASYPAAYWI
jgi:hypothetical protein